MKCRNGFVSNSSSSSFVCVACGEVQAGFDMSLSDSGMVECVNGHTFCEEHLLGPKYDLTQEKERLTKELADAVTDANYSRAAELKEQLKDIDTEYIPDDPDCNVIASSCPICMLKVIPDSVLLQFLLELKDLSRVDAEDLYRTAQRKS